MKDLVIVKTYASRVEAEIGKSKLAANAIESIILADDAGGQEGFLLNATGFVKLAVVKQNYKKAKLLLDIKSL